MQFTSKKWTSPLWAKLAKFSKIIKEKVGFGVYTTWSARSALKKWLDWKCPKRQSKIIYIQWWLNMTLPHQHSSWFSFLRKLEVYLFERRSRHQYNLSDTKLKLKTWEKPTIYERAATLCMCPQHRPDQSLSWWFDFLTLGQRLPAAVGWHHRLEATAWPSPVWVLTCFQYSVDRILVPPLFNLRFGCEKCFLHQYIPKVSSTAQFTGFKSTISWMSMTLQSNVKINPLCRNLLRAEILYR